MCGTGGGGREGGLVEQTRCTPDVASFASKKNRLISYVCNVCHNTRSNSGVLRNIQTSATMRRHIQEYKVISS